MKIAPADNPGMVVGVLNSVWMRYGLSECVGTLRKGWVGCEAIEIMCKRPE